MQLYVINEEIQVMTQLSSYPAHERVINQGQMNGINIQRRVMSGLPAEIFLVFNVVVCIVAG